MAPDTTTGLAEWPELRQQRKAIVVVDVVESVRLMQANEADVIDRWRRFVNEVRTQVLPAHGGRLVKSLGDGLLLEFESVQAALETALTLLRIVPNYNEGRGTEESLRLRMGGHVCEVVVDDLDLYGNGVNLAARLMTIAPANSLIVSPEFRERAVDGVDAEFEDTGEVYLKHFDAPVHAVRVYEAGFFSGGATRLAPTLTSLSTHEPSIAVLPLLSAAEGSRGQPGGDTLGELVADGVIGRLASHSGLRVISRLSSTAVAYRKQSLRDIANLLGCDYVLSGNWHRIGRALVLSVELAEQAGGTTVWAERVRSSVHELLQHDDSATAHIADQCVLRVLEHRLAQVTNRPLPTLHAYSLQLLGMSLMHRSPTRDFLRAGEVFDHLIERHPSASQPRAWLAQWHVLRVTRGIAHDLHAEGVRALEQTRRALDIDPQSALSLAMEGFVQCHIVKDLEAAEQRLAAAVALRPSEPLAWLFKCVVAGFRGDGANAWLAAERALALSPLDPMRGYFDALASSAALSVGRLDTAVSLAERALRTNRQHLPTLRALTIALAEKGELQRAKASVQRILELDPNFSVAAYLRDAPRGAGVSRERYATALRRAGIPAA